MDSLFGQTFSSVFGGMLNIFLIAALAAFLTRRNIVSQDVINGLSKLVVMVFLPLLIFNTITLEFDPDQQSYWWTIPIAAILLASMGLLISYLLFLPEAREKRYLFPLASMQNAAYLILPIGKFVYREQFEEFSLICFLVVLGLSPFMWTVGKLLLTANKKESPGIRKIFTPPFVANVISIILVLTHLNDHVPDFINNAAGFLGAATVPVATFILGATLAISIRSVPALPDTLKVLSVKFIALPLIAIVFLKIFKTGENFPLLSDVLVIQSASAPATAHILQIRTYGGNLKAAGGIILVAYGICLFAIPLWLTVWKIL